VTRWTLSLHSLLFMFFNIFVFFELSLSNVNNENLFKRDGHRELVASSLPLYLAVIFLGLVGRTSNQILNALLKKLEYFGGKIKTWSDEHIYSAWKVRDNYHEWVLRTVDTCTPFWIVDTRFDTKAQSVAKMSHNWSKESESPLKAWCLPYCVRCCRDFHYQT